MASHKVNTRTGTIGDTVAHLSLWCSRPGSGLARVDYLSEHSARQCMEELRLELANRNLPFHEFHLPGDLTPPRLARLWIDKLNALDVGVVSMTGFAEAFSAGPGLEEELSKLNYYRERLAEPPLRQIWWMPADFADHFLRAAPDLNSWFTKRLRLEEHVAGETFFISHTNADRAWAEWVARQLEDAGFACRLQAWAFRPGTDFVRQIDQSLADADQIIVVLSPRYLDSTFAVSEWQAAVSKDGSDGQRKLLNVRVAPCDVPLPNTVDVDLVNLDEENARRALLAGVAARRGQPDIAATRPRHPRYTSPRSPRFPGSQPRIWNVPHPRIPNFVGREELLAHLRSALLSGKPANLIQAITGLGGVGKTEAAVEFAHRHVDDFDVSWWIRCEHPATLANDFAALADPLDLPEKDSQDQELVIAAVREWLERHPRWLLVFDDVQSPEDLPKYLPRELSGQALVTSQHANWRGRAARLHLEVFRRDESIQFLLQRAGKTGRDSSESEVASERQAADWLAAELGDLPLALDLAAAYIRGTGLTMKEYLRVLQEHSPALAVRVSSPKDYRLSVAAAFSLSIERARQQSPHCEALLNLCAFLAPDDIPIDLLLDGAAERSKLPELAPLHDERMRHKAVESLLQYSLLERSGETVSIHRLVQAVVYDRLSETDRGRWAERVLQMVNEHLATDVDTNVSCWPTYARLLTHALTAVEHSDKLNLASDTLTRVLNQIGQYLHLRAQFAEAEPLLRRALAIDEQTYGAEHSLVAIRLNNLAQLLKATNRLTEAEPLMRRALAIFHDSLGPDHPHTQIVAENLQRLLELLRPET